MTEMAIYFDSSRCTDCRGCQAACKNWNGMPSPITTAEDGSSLSTHSATKDNPYIGTYQNPPDLNGDTRLIMRCNEFENTESQKGVALVFSRRSCQHCTNAGCVRICPTGALFHNDDTGMVEFDQDKCIMCHYCRTACPFDVPRYTESGLPGAKGKIEKCDGCATRVENGLKPACVTTCQPEALDFGPRSEMVIKATSRVATLKERGFSDAYAYGLDEMDGLHVISVLKYGVERHEFVDNPRLSNVVPLSEVAKPLAAIGVGLTVLGLAGSYINGRGYSTGDLAYDEKTGVETKDGKVIATYDPADVIASEKPDNPVHKVSRRGTKGGE
ncbi:MAG: 4Fe-4S dicluster domain-containing protein [Coriobacteriales bacterium]|jgi:formate dehydrogenase beta subunit